ncbi:XPG domain-containing domain-containing protein [Trichoderma sp. SZMC 28012]
MGIPHLITTLENYASHETLQHQVVVIDGPALAYHVLHLCRFQGANVPSYGLLSRLVIEWLDRLEDQQVTIRAIYFDGYLPESKQPVRMERVMKVTSRLNLFYSSNSMACPRKHVVPTNDIYLDANRPGRFTDKTSLDPAFLVPAIIDAVRGSPRYREKCFVIPGEADAYCASDIAKHSGTILTSDSDLLAHDLGSGKVVFFRDIHENASSMLACVVYAPREIYTKIGLSKSVEACRLGYERLRNPNATLPLLLKACSKPIADALDYDHFRQQYVHHESAPVPHLVDGSLLPLSGLDPRVSELLLQIGQAPRAKNAREKAKIFLPSLFDNPTKGTSWDASAHVRTLAYTAACRYLQCRCSMSVEEYRRVQNIIQKGREISLLSNNEANIAASELLELLRRVRETNIAQQYQWVLLCVILDVIECNQQGKNSHTLITLQRSGGSLTATGDKISWDLIHFSAHIQAGLYSLRILSQVLSSVIVETNSTDEFTLNLIQIGGILAELPPLHEYPDVCLLSDFLKASREQQILNILSEFITFEQAPSQGEQSRPKAEDKNPSKRGGKSQGINKKTNKKTSNSSAKRGNKFNVLSIDT